MNFSLYLILFLIIGTVFFGLAFPFMIMFIGVLLAAFIVMWLIRLLRGGSGFTVYTSRGFGRSAGEEPEAEPTRRRIYSSDGPTPPRGGYDARGPYINVAADDEEMAEAVEVIELPATALRKDDGEETK
ncbi:MAG TPA: hypothetical protein IAC22_00785 [Candidatus Caccocola faecipullorum]|nr:hypothetical protein [Candidatus Caccocola faecipullorum]